MISNLSDLAEKIKEWEQAGLRASEARTEANRRIGRTNEAILAAGAVPITSRGAIDRLHAAAQQAQKRADELHRQFVSTEATIIEGFQRLLAEALRREGETNRHIADLRARLDEISQRLGATNDLLAGHGDRIADVTDKIGQTTQYLVSVVNPVGRSMTRNTALLGEVRDSISRLADRLSESTRFRTDGTSQVPVHVFSASDVGESGSADLAPSPEQARSLPEKTVALMFAASPDDQAKGLLDHEMRDIQEQLASSRLGHLVQFELCPAAQLTDLFDRLNRFAPRLVHFSGHGSAEGIVLTTPRNISRTIAPGDLIRTVRTALEVPPVILFNICDSAGFAEQAAQSADAAIGMAGPIQDGAARTFTVGFYGGIASGKSVKAAFAQGVQAVRNAGHPHASYPQLYSRADVDLAKLWLVRPDR